MATILPALSGPAHHDLIEFDPDRSIQQRLRFALIALVVLVFGAGLSAAFVPIGGAVMASGQIGVESRIKRISHPVGGVIAELYVQNGDHVTKGEILMRLDDKVTGEDARLSSLSVDQLLAQRARLEAERLGVPDIAFPPELTQHPDAAASKAMADERKLFEIRRTEQGGMRAQLRARITQYEQQIAGYRAQITALQKQAALIEPERRGVKDLWDKDLVTLSRLNQLERTQVDMQGSIAALQAQIAQTEAHITEARQQILQLGETSRSDAGAQLATVNGTLNQQQVRSVSAGDTHERSVIRAPYSGTVDKLAFTTLGEVVKPAETIMEIVPDADKMIVEAAVNPTDIDQVHVGQDVRIRFSAFSVTRTPEAKGRVIMVAPDRTVDEQAQHAFYAARIAIDKGSMGSDAKLQLVPGMPAEVFIRTGDRSMISYVTKPLRDQFSRAFKDN